MARQNDDDTPTFHIAYQLGSGHWRLFKGEHNHRAIFITREHQTVDGGHRRQSRLALGPG
jgi:hypothetical protein